MGDNMLLVIKSVKLKAVINVSTLTLIFSNGQAMRVILRKVHNVKSS